MTGGRADYRLTFAVLTSALVSFTPTFLTPAPNVTVFQFNPETMTHTWSQPDRGGQAAPSSGIQAGNPLAVPGMPGEEFSLTVVFDSNQDIEDRIPVSAQLGEVSGVYTRLAALEMMLYPVTGNSMSSLLGQASAALGLGGAAGSGSQVPDSTVPSASWRRISTPMRTECVPRTTETVS